jgi:hypothetical protein
VYSVCPVLPSGGPARIPVGIEEEQLLYSSKTFIWFGIKEVKSKADHQQDCNQRQQYAYHLNLSEAVSP